jgi:transcriptional regulator with XRE-family HTH domain
MLLFINSMMRTIWKRMARKAYREGYVAAHISNTIASQITKLRTARGWTQTELAQHAGMKQSRISALEDPNWQNVELTTVLRLASAFDVGMVMRFVPFSEIATWAATLTDEKLVVPTYEEEARSAVQRLQIVPGSEIQVAGSFQETRKPAPPEVKNALGQNAFSEDAIRELVASANV